MQKALHARNLPDVQKTCLSRFATWLREKSRSKEDRDYIASLKEQRTFLKACLKDHRLINSTFLHHNIGHEIKEIEILIEKLER